MYDWHDFSMRFRELCDEYCDVERPDPPTEGISELRFNSLISGARKPTPDELLIISEGFDVSINYLMTGDELFPSLHGLKKKMPTEFWMRLRRHKGNHISRREWQNEQQKGICN